MVRRSSVLALRWSTNMFRRYCRCSGVAPLARAICNKSASAFSNARFARAKRLRAPVSLGEFIVLAAMNGLSKIGLVLRLAQAQRFG